MAWFSLPSATTINILFCLFISVAFVSSKNKFEPYELNGGLITGIAGQDFSIIASDTRLMDGGYEIYTRNHISSRLWFACDNTIIGSSGCSTDCESLKRYIRSQVRSANKLYYGCDYDSSADNDSGIGSQYLSVNNIATLLSQTLYLRRGFPFYSFCVVAGLSSTKEYDQKRGEVYVYDAIGSYEQVAIGTSGTGRELLQPILDRLFAMSSSSSKSGSSNNRRSDGEEPSSFLPSLPLSTTKKHVDCKVEEAISKLVTAYKSVCEREISIGDNLVIIVLQKECNKKQEDSTMNKNEQDMEILTTTTEANNIQVLNIPLKQH